jgi:hypothetical protein
MDASQIVNNSNTQTYHPSFFLATEETYVIQGFSAAFWRIAWANIAL